LTLFTGSDIFGRCWQVLYNVISGNVLDPRSGTSTDRAGSRWIFADYPDIQVGKETSFPGFPIITIDTFQSDSNNITMGANGLRTYDLISTITTYTKSASQKDVVNSAVQYALISKRDALLASGLRDLFIGAGGTDTTVISRNDKIHTSVIPIRFKAEL
jgi:hypothetical protein